MLEHPTQNQLIIGEDAQLAYKAQSHLNQSRTLAHLTEEKGRRGALVIIVRRRAEDKERETGVLDGEREREWKRRKGNGDNDGDGK